MDQIPNILPTDMVNLVIVNDAEHMLIQNKYYIMKYNGVILYLIQTGQDAPRANEQAAAPQYPDDFINVSLLKKFNAQQNEWEDVPARANGSPRRMMVNVTDEEEATFYIPEIQQAGRRKRTRRTHKKRSTRRGKRRS